MKLKMMSIALLLMACAQASAATYTVGPTGSGKQYTQLSAVFTANNLNPGDIVEVDGGATYNSVVVQGDDGGSEANPVIIRWNKAAGGTRPKLSGGAHTIKFQQSNHVVLDGFEITGGSTTCVFNEANNTTVRNSVIHDCPGHGILAADQLSGSFTLEYSEIYNAGASSNRHPMYIQSDEVAFPNSVFRMQFNYIHNGTGGNLLKARHQRSEIYYNWFEGATYQAIELIGPDCYEQQGGWTTDLKREDADIVGNVIIQGGTWPNAIRMGGDLNGRSQGRVRLVNNTILFPRAGAANAVMVQLGAESLEMHNNVVYQTGGNPVILKENVVDDTPEPCSPQSTSPWSYGRKVAGSYNWVQTNATQVPAEWSATLRGTDPNLTNIATRLLRPAAGSPLLNAGTNNPITPAAFPFPSPLAIPAYDPPLRVRQEKGDEHARLPVISYSIGSLEQFDIDDEIDPVCTRKAPVLTLAGNATNLAAGTAFVYTATLRNEDTATCAATTFSLSGSAPAGWGSNLSNATLTLAPGASATANWSVASPANVTTGTYPVSLQTTSSQSIHAVSASNTYGAIAASTCQRKAPLVSLTGPSADVFAGTTVTYQASITNQDTAQCAATTFSLASSAPSGWSKSLTPVTLNLAPGSSGTAALAITSTASAAVGSYNVGLGTSSADSSLHTQSAVVVYRIKAAACVRNKPSVLVGSPTKNDQGQSTYPITLNNLDSATCSNTSFNLSARQPSGSTGWGLALAESSKTLAPGAAWSTSLLVTQPVGLPPGTYQLPLDHSSSRGAHSGTVMISHTKRGPVMGGPYPPRIRPAGVVAPAQVEIQAAPPPQSSRGSTFQIWKWVPPVVLRDKEWELDEK